MSLQIKASGVKQSAFAISVFQVYVMFWIHFVSFLLSYLYRLRSSCSEILVVASGENESSAMSLFPALIMMSVSQAALWWYSYAQVLSEITRLFVKVVRHRILAAFVWWDIISSSFESKQLPQKSISLGNEKYFAPLLVGQEIWTRVSEN